MSFETSGFDDLFQTLERLDKVGTTAGKKAIKQGLKPVLKRMKSDAPRDTGLGSQALKVTGVKQFKNDTIIGYCGIDSSNWEESKHLLFQHYGYSNKGLNFTGQPSFKHVGWMTASYERSKREAEAELKKALIKELDNIFD